MTEHNPLLDAHVPSQLAHVPCTQLSMSRDGIAGRDLGIVGAWQYAITFPSNQAGYVYTGEIFRRRADEAGRYGGWRWECSAAHPGRLPNDAHLAELASRVEIARDVERATLEGGRRPA